MKRTMLLDAALVLAPIAAIVAACAASPQGEPEEPVIVSTEGDPASADNPDPALARQAALEQAESVGILGLLSTESDGGLASIFGSDETLGTDLTGALGGLTGETIGESFGAGGLGLRGTGLGGGGTGEGIGLGSMGTIGHGSGTGTGQGYGTGYGRLGGSSRKQPTQVRAEDAKVQGSLPREVIQRVVRRHMAQLRYCYEKGLIKNPTLEGKVVTRFVIGADGAVTGVTTSGTMPDATVAECIRKVFERMSFPTPDPAGLVVVTYPVVFSPGGSDSTTTPAPSTPSAAPAPPPPSPPAAPPAP